MTFDEFLDSDLVLKFISDNYGDDWEQMDRDGNTLSIYGIFNDDGELMDESDYEGEDLFEHELDSWDKDEIARWAKENKNIDII